jgi:hypothetical protein
MLDLISIQEIEMNSLNEKYRLILENDQPESSGDEDLLAGIDASIDDSIKTGLIKIKDLPPEEVQDYLRRNNLQVTLPSNAQATDNEQAYIRILKQIKPKGPQASEMLGNGEPVNLKLGRATILDNYCYVFNYDTAIKYKVLSSPTISNLETLKYTLGLDHKTVYVTLSYAPGTSQNWRTMTRQLDTPRYTFVVTGVKHIKAEGAIAPREIPYAYVRKETASLQAGQTKLYGPLSNVLVSHLLRPGYDMLNILRSIGLY